MGQTLSYGTGKSKPMNKQDTLTAAAAAAEAFEKCIKPFMSLPKALPNDSGPTPLGEPIDEASERLIANNAGTLVLLSLR